MTPVVPFPRARPSSGSPAEFPAGHSATILLFTGVRYERHVGGGPHSAGSDDSGRDDNATSRRRKARRRA